MSILRTLVPKVDYQIIFVNLINFALKVAKKCYSLYFLEIVNLVKFDWENAIILFYL